MPDSFEIVFWLIIVAVFWLRGLSAAAKKARAREQQALEGTERNLGLESGQTEVQRRRSVLGGWVDMAKQIEQQMQEAAAEGRPGSFVAHIEDDDEDDHTIVIPGRRVLPAPQEASLPERRAEALPIEADERRRARRSQEVTRARPTHEPPTYERRTHERATHERRASAPPTAWSPRVKTSRRSASTGPLGRLDRYPPVQRAIILSEILGTPPGLRERPREDI